MASTNCAPCAPCRVPVTPGTLGITDGCPVVVDPTDSTKAVSTDNLSSAITTELLGIALSPVTDGTVLVAVSGIIPDTPSTLAPNVAQYATHGGTGYTTTDPGDGTDDPLYLGFPLAVSQFYVDIVSTRSGASVGGGASASTPFTYYGPWTAVTLSVSAGSVAALPAGATATGYIDVEGSGAKTVQLGLIWTYGSSPDDEVTLGIYEDVDGTHYSSSPMWFPNFSIPASTPASMYHTWPVHDNPKFKAVLYNNDSTDDITSVSMVYREVRG